MSKIEAVKVRFRCRKREKERDEDVRRHTLMLSMKSCACRRWIFEHAPRKTSCRSRRGAPRRSWRRRRRRRRGRAARRCSRRPTTWSARYERCREKQAQRWSGAELTRAPAAASATGVQAFEARLVAAESDDDPLEVWLEYLGWMDRVRWAESLWAVRADPALTGTGAPCTSVLHAMTGVPRRSPQHVRAGHAPRAPLCRRRALRKVAQVSPRLPGPRTCSHAHFPANAPRSSSGADTSPPVRQRAARSTSRR